MEGYDDKLSDDVAAILAEVVNEVGGGGEDDDDDDAEDGEEYSEEDDDDDGDGVGVDGAVRLQNQNEAAASFAHQGQNVTELQIDSFLPASASRNEAGPSWETSRAHWDMMGALSNMDVPRPSGSGDRVRLNRDMPGAQDMAMRMLGLHRIQRNVANGRNVNDNLPNEGNVNDQLPNDGNVNDQLPNVESVNDQMPNIGNVNDQMPNVGNANDQMPNVVNVSYFLAQNEDVNGHVLNDGSVNGHFPNDGNVNGHLPNDGNVNGHFLNDGSVNGHFPNDGNVNGNLPNDGNANGHLPNGNVNGHLLNDGSVNGHFPNDGNVNDHLPDDGNVNGHLPNDGNVNGHLPNDGNVNGHLPNDGNVNGHLPNDGNVNGHLPNDGNVNGHLPNDGNVNDPFGIAQNELAEDNSMDSDVEVEYDTGDDDIGDGQIQLFEAMQQNLSLEELAALYLFSSDEERGSGEESVDGDAEVDNDDGEVDIEMLIERGATDEYRTNSPDSLDATFLAPSSNASSPPSSPPEHKVLADPSDLIRPFPLVLLCAVCQSKADYLCSSCWKIAYCSEEHQHNHFDQHKVECEHHMLLRRSETLRHSGPVVLSKMKPSIAGENQTDFILTAAADVEKDSVLIEEKPFLISPWCRTQLRRAEVEGTRHLFMRNMTCFGCCKYLGFSYTTCKACSLPLCSVNCPEKKIHEQNECHFVASMLSQEGNTRKRDRFNLNNFRTPNGDKQIRFLYMDVMIVRLMIKFSQIQSKDGQEQFELVYSKLCATWKTNLEHRLSTSPTAKKLSLDIDDALPISCYVSKGKLDVIMNYYSIIEGNSYRFDRPFCRFNALCTVLNHAEHNCKPNSIAVLKGNTSGTSDCTEPALEDFTIKLRAGKELIRGEAVSICYVPVFLGTVGRRNYLQDWYNFWCTCKRCQDPSEDGSYTSSPNCPNCSAGRLLPPISTLDTKPASDSHWPLPLHSGNEDNSQVMWTCTNNRTKKCDILNGSAASQKRVLDAIEEIEEGSCIRLGSLKDIGEFITTITGLGGRYGPTGSRRNNVTVPKTHFVLLKILDDLLRGALFPLPDFSIESLDEFDTKALNVIAESFKVYSSAMSSVQAGFKFEGFPRSILNMAINEYEIRKQSPTAIHDVVVNPAVINNRNLLRTRSVRISQGGDVVWPGRQRAGNSQSRLHFLHAAIAAGATGSSSRLPTSSLSLSHVDLLNRELSGARNRMSSIARSMLPSSVQVNSSSASTSTSRDHRSLDL